MQNRHRISLLPENTSITLNINQTFSMKLPGIETAELQGSSVSGSFFPDLLSCFISRMNNQAHNISLDMLAKSRRNCFRKQQRNTMGSAVYIIVYILYFKSDLLCFSIFSFQNCNNDFTARRYKIFQLIFLCQVCCPTLHSTRLFSYLISAVSFYKVFVIKGFPLLKTEHCLSSGKMGRKGMEIRRIKGMCTWHSNHEMPSIGSHCCCQFHAYSRSKLSSKHFAVNMAFYFPVAFQEKMTDPNKTLP